MNLPSLNENAWLLDLSIIFSSRLLPLTLTILITDIVFLCFLIAARQRANHAYLKKKAAMYSFWMDAHARFRRYSEEGRQVWIPPLESYPLPSP
mgnify:CR=1 FL=1